MITSNDFSFLIVTMLLDKERLRLAYICIRDQYPDNDIIIVYDNKESLNLSEVDPKVIEIVTKERVFVSGGYNIALRNCKTKCFVFLHDDTFIAENFLENLIPYTKPDAFCNFTTVEPPVFNDPNSLKKPIKDFGRSTDLFSIKSFNDFCKEHITTLKTFTEESNYGGFFLAGYVDSILSVGGFDENFKPYFYEDGDLMMRLHIAGYRFIHVLNAIVYHMGSMSSRADHQETMLASDTTMKIFLKKWKARLEVLRHYTIDNNIPYNKQTFTVTCTNCDPNLTNYCNILSDGDEKVQVHIDGLNFNNEDVHNLQIIPYIINQITDAGDYQIGSITISKL